MLLGGRVSALYPPCFSTRMVLAKARDSPICFTARIFSLLSSKVATIPAKRRKIWVICSRVSRTLSSGSHGSETRPDQVIWQKLVAKRLLRYRRDGARQFVMVNRSLSAPSWTDPTPILLRPYRGFCNRLWVHFRRMKDLNSSRTCRPRSLTWVNSFLRKPRTHLTLLSLLGKSPPGSF